jgi:preprotein translocase subunit SecF
MYAHLRENEPKIKQADAKKQAAAAKRQREVDATAGV